MNGWEMDRPISQLIAPEIIFQRREERARCGKQRIVFLEGGEIQHRLSVQLVSTWVLRLRHRVRISSAPESSYARAGLPCTDVRSNGGRFPGCIPGR